MLRSLWQGLDLLDIGLVLVTLDRHDHDQLTELDHLQRLCFLGDRVQIGRVQLGQVLTELLLQVPGDELVQLLQVVVPVYPVVTHVGRLDGFEPFGVTGHIMQAYEHV